MKLLTFLYLIIILSCVKDEIIPPEPPAPAVKPVNQAPHYKLYAEIDSQWVYVYYLSNVMGFSMVMAPDTVTLMEPPDDPQYVRSYNQTCIYRQRTRKYDPVHIRTIASDGHEEIISISL